MGEKNKVEQYAKRLLHIEDVPENKFVDLYCPRGETFFIEAEKTPVGNAAELFYAAKMTMGKTPTVTLKNSALTGADHIPVDDERIFLYFNKEGRQDIGSLDSFRETAQKEIQKKGNNPCFLSLGAIRWEISLKANETKTVLSPLIIFPVVPVRSGGNASPVRLRFVEEDVFLNPSLLAKFASQFGKDVADAFPRPPQDADIDIVNFDLTDYFDEVQEFVSGCVARRPDALFEFLPNTAALAMYKNSDICTYYDIRRNIEKIEKHPLIRAAFEGEKIQKADGNFPVSAVLPCDQSQYELLKRAVNGDSLLIKGPPGSGKTQTIVNLISGILGLGKRVLFVSAKASALNEVYKKMPTDLRPFVLYTPSETESDVAKDGKNAVATLIDGLSAVKNMKSEESFPLMLDKRNASFNKRMRATASILDYRELLYAQGRVISDSLYSALDRYCKYADIDTPSFDSEETAFTLSNGEYLELSETVKKLGEKLEFLTLNYTFPLVKNPWNGLKIDAEEGVLSDKILALCDSLRAFGKNEQEDALAKLDIMTLSTLARYNLTKKETTQILSVQELDAFAIDICVLASKIEENRQDMIPYMESGEKLFLPDADLTELDALYAIQLDNRLTLSALKALSPSQSVLDKLADLSVADINALFILIQEKAKQEQIAIDARKQSAKVLDKADFGEEKTVRNLLSCYDGLEKAIRNQKSAPTLLEKGWVKKAMKYVKAFEYTTFTEILSALEWTKKFANAVGAMTELHENINMVFKQKTDKETLGTLLEIYHMLDGDAQSIANTAKSLGVEWLLLTKYADRNQFLHSVTVGDMKKMFHTAELRVALKDEKTLLSERYPFLQSIQKYEDNLSVFATQVHALTNIGKRMESVNGTDPERQAEFIINGSKKAELWEMKYGFIHATEEMAKFAKEHCDNSFYADLRQVSVVDCLRFATLIPDVNRRYAMVEYQHIKSRPHKVNLGAFFASYESGQRTEQLSVSWVELFEHAVLKLALQAVSTRLRNKASVLSRHKIAENNQNFAQSEMEERELNARFIAEMLIPESIDEDQYAFLNKKTRFRSPRILFKNYAKQILNLKRCFIMSPSAVSSLLRHEEFENFDTVIFDEASLIPPEYVVTSLYRAKQCLIVGDENQMPPIKHIARLSETDEEPEDGLEVVASALDLMLDTQGFDIVALTGHFRSKTETLVDYSQRKYYPFMTTFPAAKPRGEDLGLFDIRVEDGRSVKGVNAVEAKEVVRLLNAHFARYYDEEHRTLKKSVGIITFGLEQAGEVEKRIGEDKELSRRLSHALNAYQDLPEKLFFIRSIYTAQGLEADKVILSVTYGRTEKGEWNQNFSKLNTKLGERIFNVAVTRARECVYFVHSTDAQMLSVASLQYLREYMEKVAYFDSEDAKTQFVGRTPSKGFFRDVGEALIQSGIDRARIVYDYGVTERSYKVPLAVLDKECKQAEVGLMLEHEYASFDFLDAQIRYPNILESSRGWKLYPIGIYDWVFNRETEKQNLYQFIRDNVSLQTTGGNNHGINAKTVQSL